MTIAFDNTNKHILLTGSDATTLSVQNLINSIRDYEDSETHIQYPIIANASGKADLGDGVLTAITVELLNSWQIKHEAGSYQAFVTGGNLIGGIAGNPVATTTGVQVVLNQSANGVIVATGSGLTSTEQTRLAEIWKRLNLDPATDMTHSDDGGIAGAGIEITTTTSGTDVITSRTP